MRARHVQSKEQQGGHGVIRRAGIGLIIGVLLLASVATASGECAWILWDEELRCAGDDCFTRTTLRASASGYEQCEKRRAEAVTNLYALTDSASASNVVRLTVTNHGDTTVRTIHYKTGGALGERHR